MKIRNRFNKVIVMLIMMTLLVPSTLPVNKTIPVQAAEKIKLSEKTLILSPGDTDILQVKGTKKKATWTSSDSTIVSVSNKGIVVAKSIGKAVITAKVSNKKLTCTVAVMGTENPYVGTAPFTAKQIDFGNVSSVIPKDWTYSIINSESGSKLYYINPTSMDLNKDDYTGITLSIVNSGINAPAYDTVKEYFSQKYTIENLETALKTDKYKVSVTDLEQSDLTTTLGTAYTVKLNANFSDDTKSFTQKMVFYNLYFDQYFIVLGVVNVGNTVTPDISQVAVYMLNSLQVNK